MKKGILKIFCAYVVLVSFVLSANAFTKTIEERCPDLCIIQAGGTCSINSHDPSDPVYFCEGYTNWIEI